MFSDLMWFENATIHYYIDTGSENLNRSDGASHIKHRVAVSELGGIHWAGHYDRFTWNILKYLCGINHCIRAMSDNNSFQWSRPHFFSYQLTVFICEIEAVFSKNRFNLVVQNNISPFQNSVRLWISNLIVWFLVEVNLVDSTTSCVNFDFHILII